MHLTDPLIIFAIVYVSVGLLGMAIGEFLVRRAESRAAQVPEGFSALGLACIVLLWPVLLTLCAKETWDLWRAAR